MSLKRMKLRVAQWLSKLTVISSFSMGSSHQAGGLDRVSLVLGLEWSICSWESSRGRGWTCARGKSAASFFLLHWEEMNMMLGWSLLRKRWWWWWWSQRSQQSASKLRPLRLGRLVRLRKNHFSLDVGNGLHSTPTRWRATLLHSSQNLQHEFFIKLRLDEFSAEMSHWPQNFERWCALCVLPRPLQRQPRGFEYIFNRRGPWRSSSSFFFFLIKRVENGAETSAWQTEGSLYQTKASAPRKKCLWE